jgi:hypothetical protein
MSQITIANNISHSQKRTAYLLTLVLDENTDVAMADRPIFGTTVTIRDDIESLIGGVLQAGLVIGWLNYVDVTKFACISDDRHFQEACHYFHVESNQLILSKPVVLHNVDNNMSKTKQLFTFSTPSGNVRAIRQA